MELKQIDSWIRRLEKITGSTCRLEIRAEDSGDLCLSLIWREGNELCLSSWLVDAKNAYGDEFAKALLAIQEKVIDHKAVKQ